MDIASRFRRNAFGWRSQPAIARINEAVSEITAAARQDKALAAEGALNGAADKPTSRR